MALRADDVDLVRDSALVERFQAGDESAFDELYRRYFARLARFCLRRVGDRDEAEELAQEAFARALRAMPQFAGERRFYPWLTVIANRLCVDSHRRRGRSTPSDDIDLGSIEADHDAVFDEVDRHHLALALDRLAPRHREVLEQREAYGWSYQRIAEHNDVSLGTVEALLHRARRALRREFEKVAGEGAGRWAAIPGIAWLGRRWRGLRIRMATRLGELPDAASPLAVKIASVALAAGSVVVMGHGGGASPEPTAKAASVRSPVSIAAAAVPAPAPTPPASSAPAPTPTARRDVAATVRSTSTTLPPAVIRVGRSDAQRFNESAPVRAPIPGGSIGADPGALVRDAGTGLQIGLDQLLKGLTP